MSQEGVTLRSTIYPALMRRMVFRGTCLSSMGGVLLLLAGAFLAPALLKIWGLPIFLCGLVLITSGLLPYRRLRYLENHPHRLLLEEEALIYFSRNRQQFALPLSLVAKVEYVEKNHRYGIKFTFKESIATDLNSELKLVEYHRRSLKEYGCDLFLPYFSKRSCQELSDFL